LLEILAFKRYVIYGSPQNSEKIIFSSFYAIFIDPIISEIMKKEKNENSTRFSEFFEFLRSFWIIFFENIFCINQRVIKAGKINCLENHKKLKIVDILLGKKI
jgi:hypothetical protein